MRPVPKQAFQLDDQLLESVSMEEVEATYNDMLSLDLAHAPYSDMDLLLRAKWLFRPMEKVLSKEQLAEMLGSFGRWTVVFRYEMGDEEASDVLIDYSDGSGYFSLYDVKSELKVKQSIARGVWTEDQDRTFIQQMKEATVSWRKLLIVLLATRHITKTTVKDKLACLGIGKNKKRNWYTTTISLPKPQDIGTEANGAGTSKRPHLRRGHVRSQHHGPHNQLVKRIWLEPCFVNCDANFMLTRTAYNVSKQKE